MDLSKAYDCILHELLIAKLKYYGIENGSLQLLLDDLTNQKQKTKIGSSFSSWCDISPLSANPIKWSNTLKQFVGKLPTNCLSVFDYFVKLAVKGLI